MVKQFANDNSLKFRYIYTDELTDKKLEDKKIDALYIGIAQRFFNYDIDKLSVKIIL